MHKQEAEANIFKAVLAVAAGSTSAVRQQPVSGLVLKGLVGATDRVLAEALQQLKGLRWEPAHTLAGASSIYCSVSVHGGGLCCP